MKVPGLLHNTKQTDNCQGVVNAPWVSSILPWGPLEVIKNQMFIIEFLLFWAPVQPVDPFTQEYTSANLSRDRQCSESSLPPETQGVSDALSGLPHRWHTDMKIHIIHTNTYKTISLCYNVELLNQLIFLFDICFYCVNTINTVACGKAAHLPAALCWW